MSSVNFVRYLVTDGDLPVNGSKAPGDSVFTTGSVGSPYNVLSGELVVFDPKTKGVLGPADIATASKIAVAVGVGPKGQIAEDLRFIGGKSVNLCDFQMRAHVAGPNCGTPQEVDFFVSSALCGGSKSIVVYLDDYVVRSYYQYNEQAKYTFTAEVPCDCGECTPKEVCNEWVCRIVDQINGGFKPDPSKVSYFQNRKPLADAYQPFYAVKLYNEANSLKTFCITPNPSPCDGCIDIGSIRGIEINGNQTLFDYTTVPGDDTRTFLGQLKRVLALIREALKPVGGDAYITKGINDCCSQAIKISVCNGTTVNLLGGDPIGPIAPCDEENTFSTVDLEQYCKSCGTTVTPVDFPCGFRIVVDPVEVECLCDLPPDQIPNYYGRTVRIQPVGENWGCELVYTREAQSQVLPENFGFFWKDRERWQSTGAGLDYRYTDSYRGKRGFFPIRGSKILSTTVDCNEMYCVYALELTQGRVNGFPHNAYKRFQASWNFVLIPYGDNTTKASWEQYLNAMYQRGLCNAPNLTCP